MHALLAAAQLTLAPFSPSGTFTLRVLTYNIYGLPTHDEPSHQRYAKIGGILAKRREEGTAPHVVVIQEAFHPRTAELIEAAGYPFYRFGAVGHSDSPLPSGLVILSEFPIEKAATIDYRRCAGWDCWANKGALHVRVKVPGLSSPVDVFNTHMNAGPDEPGRERDAAVEVRKDQAAQLLEFQRSARLPGAPLLSSGDFNFRGPDPDYAEFAAGSGLVNAAAACAMAACAGDPDPGRVLRESVDHHFFGSGSRLKVRPVRFERSFTEPVDGGPLSDHDGIEAVYELSWGAASSAAAR